jgi:hypothetical protein
MLLKLLNLPSNCNFHCEVPESIAHLVVLNPLRLLEVCLLYTDGSSGSGTEIQIRINATAAALDCIFYELKHSSS